MDKLIFENALGQTVEFSASSKYKFDKVDGLGGRTVKFQTTSSPFQDGVSSLDNGFFDSDVVSIEFTAVSDNLLDDIRSLNSILNPKLGAGKLKYYTGDVVRVLHGVKTRMLPDLPTGTKNRGVQFQISKVIFEVFNPYYQDDAETSWEIASQYDLFIFTDSVGGLTVTDNFVFDRSGAGGLDIYNTGDVSAPITLIADGPLSSPMELGNIVTGESIIISTSLLADERLVITTDPENIDVRKINLSTGAETSAFQYIDIPNTTFWSLKTGLNTVKFTHGAQIADSVMIYYRQKYVGV